MRPPRACIRYTVVQYFPLSLIPGSPISTDGQTDRPPQRPNSTLSALILVESLMAEEAGRDAIYNPFPNPTVVHGQTKVKLKGPCESAAQIQLCTVETVTEVLVNPR